MNIPAILWDCLLKILLQIAGYQFIVYRSQKKKVFWRLHCSFCVHGIQSKITLPDIYFRIFACNFIRLSWQLLTSVFCSFIKIQNVKNNGFGMLKSISIGACCVLKVHRWSLCRETAVNCHSMCHLQLYNSLLTSQLNCWKCLYTLQVRVY